MKNRRKEKRRLRLRMYIIIWNKIIKLTMAKVNRKKIHKNILETLITTTINLQLKIQELEDKKQYRI